MTRSTFTIIKKEKLFTRRRTNYHGQSCITSEQKAESIFTWMEIPEIERYSHQVAVLISRIKWIATKDKERNKATSWWEKKEKGKDRIWNLGNKLIPPEIQVFCNELNNACRHEVKHAVRLAKTTNKWWRTKPACHQHARRWLDNYDLIALPTDKDGGFCIACREHVKDLMMIKLRSELYEEVNVNMTDENKIKEEHMNLLKRAKKQLESAEKKLFFFLTNSAAKADWDRIASSMMMTMKTHKTKERSTSE